MNVVMIEGEQESISLDKTNKKFKCLYKGCEKFYSTSQHLTVRT